MTPTTVLHDFEDRIVLVTGAARGIGTGISEYFLERGALVLMLDRLQLFESEARKVLERFPNTALPLICDVSNPIQVEKVVNDAVNTWGPINFLVNNAGIAIFKSLDELSLADWHDVMATNLNGPFYCVKACLPSMLTVDRACIVNIASISALRASTLRVAYGTSKAALVHLTKQLAAELGIRGIRVNTVAPGPVETEMAKLVHSTSIRGDYHNAIPMNRYATVAEIAQTVAYLCSEASSFINGQTIAVDGGFDASGVGIPALRAKLLDAI